MQKNVTTMGCDKQLPEVEEEYLKALANERPNDCEMYCIHNKGGQCNFASKEILVATPLASSNCPYFKSRQSFVHKKYDYLFGFEATYVDAHSAMWKGKTGEVK